MSFTASLLCIYKKDVLSDWYRPYALVAGLLFALSLTAIYSYSLSDNVFDNFQNLTGILVSTLLFSNVLMVSQSFLRELEADALRIMNMSGLEPSAVYLAKVVVHWQNQIVFILLYIPIYFLFLQGKWQISPALFLALLVCLSCCALSLATLGVLLAYVMQDKRLRALLMPLVFFPAAVPVIIFALDFLEGVYLTGSLQGTPLLDYLVLLAPAGLYGGIGSLLYFSLAADAV